MSRGSVSRWLDPLKEGNPVAAQELWQRCFQKLVELARNRLRNRPVRGRDEEDVALSAFDTFCRNAAAGRFPQLSDRDDLWRLLVVITARKASRAVRDEGRAKRGGAAQQARHEQALLLEHVCSREPSPELAAQMTDDYERLLHVLGDEQLRQVAIWKMEGFTVEEIADKVGCVPRSVKRKLALIRTLWLAEALP